MQKIEPGHKHLIYKRSAVESERTNKKRKKKRKKYPKNCGTREPKKVAQ